MEVSPAKTEVRAGHIFLSRDVEKDSEAPLTNIDRMDSSSTMSRDRSDLSSLLETSDLIVSSQATNRPVEQRFRTTLNFYSEEVNSIPIIPTDIVIGNAFEVETVILEKEYEKKFKESENRHQKEMRDLRASHEQALQALNLKLFIASTALENEKQERERLEKYIEQISTNVDKL